MYNAKPAVASALSTDAQIITLIPKSRMFDGTAVFSNSPVYPYLTYEEIANTEALHADNREIASEITIRIHIWNDSNVSILAGHVDRIMKIISFGRNFAQDLDEMLDNGKVIKHKIMSFTGSFVI